MLVRPAISRHALLAECLLVFGGAPVLIALLVPSAWWPALLALAGVACLGAWLFRSKSLKCWWVRPLQVGERNVLGRAVSRFAVCASLLGFIVLAVSPQRFLHLPREETALWLVLLASYPLFSVVPQEVVYRYFFRMRYRRALGKNWIGASAVLFAWLHVAYGNLVAPVLCLVAGWFFATTYRASRSLRLAVFEHALYGALVFTIGLDGFFVASDVG